MISYLKLTQIRLIHWRNHLLLRLLSPPLLLAFGVHNLVIRVTGLGSFHLLNKPSRFSRTLVLVARVLIEPPAHKHEDVIQVQLALPLFLEPADHIAPAKHFLVRHHEDLVPY